jgi:hypothetical protein
MAVAVPKRSDLQTAPGPSRTAAPPEPKKRPRDRPRPGGQGRSSAAAPQALRKGSGTDSPIRKTGGTKRKAAPRKAAAAPASSPIRKAKPGETKRKASPRKASAAAAPARKGTRAATAAPARKAAPQRKKASSARASATAAPARKSPSRKPSRNGLVTAPSRHKAAPRRRPRVGTLATGAAGHAGRAAVAVTQLPESGLIHRLTRGRAWIALLGVLLIGIVGLNVVTLSFAASSGKVQERNFVLSKENTTLATLQAKKYGQEIQRHEAAAMGLAMPGTEPQMINARPTDVAEAAARLAAAAKAAQATSE